jgi:hypothetical protein
MSSNDNRAVDGLSDRVFMFIENTDGRYWAVTFFLGLIAYTGLLVVEALTYSDAAQLFPLLIGVPLLGLIVLDIGLVLFGDQIGIESVDLFEEIVSLDEEGEMRSLVDQYRREFEMILWVGVSVALIWLLGHVIALSVFVFVFIYTYERNLKRAVLATAITFGFVYLLFIVLLEANLASGVLPVGGVLP